MTSRRPYWCPKTMKRRPCWCPKPILWELNSFLMQTLSFVSINLHRCWPREWKHSIFYFPNTGHVIILWRTVSLKRISSYSRAYLRIIYEETKGQVPLGPLLGKQKTKHRRFRGLLSSLDFFLVQKWSQKFRVWWHLHKIWNQLELTLALKGGG